MLKEKGKETERESQRKLIHSAKKTESFLSYSLTLLFSNPFSLLFSLLGVSAVCSTTKLYTETGQR